MVFNPSSTIFGFLLKLSYPIMVFFVFVFVFSVRRVLLAIEPFPSLFPPLPPSLCLYLSLSLCLSLSLIFCTKAKTMRAKALVTFWMLSSILWNLNKIFIFFIHVTSKIEYIFLPLCFSKAFRICIHSFVIFSYQSYYLALNSSLKIFIVTLHLQNKC